MVKRLAFSLLALTLAACGGGDGPTIVPTPTPTPGVPVSVVVFYDENGNGQLDAAEGVRLPNVTVAVGPSTGKTTVGGVAALSVPAGTYTVTVQSESLPPFWQTDVASATVPAPDVIRIPARLPISAGATPNTYDALGDSITLGEPGGNYPSMLESALRNTLGAAWVINRGKDGADSTQGIRAFVRGDRPAYAIINFGTNDWNDQACQTQAPIECKTIGGLRNMISEVRAVGALPVLSTLLPLVDTERDKWNRGMNDLIKGLAKDEGAMVVDTYTPFSKAGSLPSLYADSVHPNARGYQVMADAYAAAFTTGRVATAADRGPFGLLSHFSSGRPRR